jgi:hypothetical protein
MRYTKSMIEKMIKPSLRLLITAVLLISVLGAYGQETINKDVKVVKAYNPTISDAFKARFIPVIDDTVQVETRFNYYIEPIKQPIQFRLKSLESVGMRPEKGPELKHSYLRAGFGNFWTPMIELDINTTRKQNTNLGFNMSHISSQGRVKMKDDQKVYAGYADNHVQMYGSRIHQKSTLSADFHFDEDHHFLYGYSTDTLSDNTLVTPTDLRVLSKDSMPNQQFLNVGTAFRLKSDERNRNGFEYQMDFDYDYLRKMYTDMELKIPEMEHSGGLKFDFSHELDQITYGAEAGGRYFYRVLSNDSVSNMIFNLDPWIGFNWEIVSLKAGPKMAIDRFSSSPYFFPSVKVEVNITNTVVPYIGIDGYYESNNLMKIKEENPYIIDDMYVEPTIHRFIAFGGLRGRFLPKAAFNLFVRWEDVKDWHFYVPEIGNPMRNRFDIVYDDGSLLSMGGEVGIHPSDKLGFILKGNYYSYDLDSLDYAWHKPAWDISFSTRYSFMENITLQADVYLIGSQFVPSVDVDKYGPAQELNGLVDINISGEYKFNPSMSAFARINNLISDNYYTWQNYPLQGLNFLLGINWSF